MRVSVAIVGIVCLVGCGEGETDKPVAVIVEAQADQQGPEAVEPIEIEPLDVGPVSFFQNACARCHGDFGWSYASGFTENYTRDELKEIVHEMVIGPAQRELGERELEALTDLHYAIDAGDEGLFLAVTSRAESLEGEGMPETTVLASSLNVDVPGGTSATATVRADGLWRVDDFDPERPHSLWSVRRLEGSKMAVTASDGRVYPENVVRSVALFDIRIEHRESDPNHPVEVLTNRGAWVAVGPSGCVLGEEDAGE